MIRRYQEKCGSKSKVTNPASRLPKRTVRSAMRNKEKTSIMADKIGRKQESPGEYAGNRIETGGTAGWEKPFAAYRGLEKEAGSENLYERIKNKDKSREEAVTAPLDGKQETAEHLPRQDRQETKKRRAQEPDGASGQTEAEKTIKAETRQ